MGRTREPQRGAETMAEFLQRQGFPAERVLMSPPPGTATEADLLEAILRGPRKLIELVDGTLVEKPMGTAESIIASPLLALLELYVYEHDLGVVLGEAGLLRLAPDSVRIADIAFVSWERLPTGLELGSIAATAPDLAVEVLSPSNTRREMDRKIRDYFLAGTRLIWLLQPRTQTAEAYTAPDERRRISKTGALDASPVVPGFRVPLTRIFSRLTRRRPT